MNGPNKKSEGQQGQTSPKPVETVSPAEVDRSATKIQTPKTDGSQKSNK